MWKAIRLNLALLLVCGACAATGFQSGEVVSSDRISTDQIRSATGSTSVYEIVAAYHPNWLTPRGVDSFRAPTQVMVYIDGIKLGGVDNLRQLSPTGIAYVQWYDGITAASRWGLDHGSGVIWVSTKRDD